MKNQEIYKLAGLMKCPVCGSGMADFNGGSIFCENRHCYDIAAKGYINFLSKAPKESYSGSLFAARQQVFRSGFFAPVTDMLVKIIDSHAGENQIVAVDAGCGEGSYLSEIKSRLENVTAMGFDIAKSGIRLAAANKDCVWCVADLAKIPLADNAADVIINVLTPSNYSEFMRVIKKDGILVKVVPSSGYLKELRRLTGKSPYSNSDVVNRLGESFKILDNISLKYKAEMTEEGVTSLMQMTPLMWNAEIPEGAVLPDSVTVDLSVLIGAY